MPTTYSFKEIWDTIYNKMLEIKYTTQNSNWIVWDVYNYDIKIENWISLPAIIITPSNWTVSLLDSCNYQNKINYTVRLIDRIYKDKSNIEDNMRVVADMVMKRLKEIWTITRSNTNGNTVSCEFTYQRGFTDTMEPLRIFEVECNFTSVEGN